MRYENINTGAVIDSPFLIGGDLWVPVDNPNQEVTDYSLEELRALILEQQAKIDELEATIEGLLKQEAKPLVLTEENEEELEEEVDLQALTNKELEVLAKEQGIELTANDKRNKDTRIAAIVSALG